MDKIMNKNYMYDLELQSLHYWFKNAPSQNPSIKYNNIFKIMKDTMDKTDLSDIINANTQQFTDFIQKSHINLHHKAILRNVFEHWKIYVVHKLHTRRAKYKADYFYHKKLQKKVLNALSKNVLLKWEHIVSSMDNCINKSIISANYKKAKVHCSKLLLRKYLKFWRDYVAMVNEKEALLEKVTIFYNLNCLKKCIINWKMFIMLQRDKKITEDKIDKAREFYDTKVLRKFIRAWSNVCEFTLQKSKTEYAIIHYENKLLVKYFDIWKMYHDYKIKKLNIEEHVLAYSRKKLLKRYFEQFIVCIKESIAEKITNENAETFYTSKLLQKVFCAWQQWYNNKVQTAIRICEIKNIFENSRKSAMFANWRLYIIKKKCKRRKIFTAKNLYEKKLAIKIFKKFHNYAIYRKEKQIRLSYLNDKSGEITRQLQNIYIEKWRNALYSTVQEKQKLNKAVKLWELNLTCKYFFHWKEFSKQYKVKIIHKQKLNEIATGFLLKKFILHWHSKLQDVLDIRKKEFLAISKMEHKILKKHFLLWKVYIIQKIKMNNDIEAAMKLHKKFLLREGLKEILRNSLYNIDYQRDLQLKNATMRSFKNFEILKEYFDKWHSSIYLKKKSESVSKIINSNECQLIQTQILRNNMFGSFKTSLVLPEYMMEKDTSSNSYNSFDKLPRKNWLLNLF